MHWSPWEHKSTKMEGILMKTAWQPSAEEGKKYSCNENSRSQQHPCDEQLPTKEFPQQTAKTVGVAIARPQCLEEIVGIILDIFINQQE